MQFVIEKVIFALDVSYVAKRFDNLAYASVNQIFHISRCEQEKNGSLLITLSYKLLQKNWLANHTVQYRLFVCLRRLFVYVSTNEVDGSSPVYYVYSVSFEFLIQEHVCSLPVTFDSRKNCSMLQNYLQVQYL